MPTTVAVVFFTNDEYCATHVFPRETSFEALRQRWREASEDPGPAFFLLKSLDGAVLPEHGSLTDVLQPNEATVAIHIICVDEKKVRVIGTQMEPVTVKILPQESMDDLRDRIKGLLGIDEERVVRLISGGRVLDAEALPSVELAGQPFVEVDLQLRFLACVVESPTFHNAIRDDNGEFVLNKDLPEDARRKTANPNDALALPAFLKGCSVRALRAFASEPARALCGVGDWRAVAWGSGKKILPDEAVCRLLSAEAILSGAISGVVLERRMQIRVEEKMAPFSYVASVWPSEKISELMTGTHDRVFVAGEPTDTWKSFWQAGLQHGSCLSITRLVSLTIFTECGETQKVDADLGEPLVDLRERLNMPEENFELFCDGELLSDECKTLLAYGVSEVSWLISRPRTRVVYLKMGRAKPVCIGAVPNTITYRTFLQKASEAIKVQLPRHTHFVCACGRVFSDECAERRDFPLRCCRAPELRLTVSPPAKGRKSQTAWRKKAPCQTARRASKATTQIEGTQPQTTTQATSCVGRATTQATSYVRRATTEAASCVGRVTTQVTTYVGRATTQTTSCVEEATNQIPPEEPLSRKSQTAWRKKAPCQTARRASEATTQIEGTQRRATTQATSCVGRATSCVGQATTQATTCVGRATSCVGQATTQATSCVGEATNQIFEEPLRIANFYIWWDFDDRGHFQVAVPFRAAPRGRQLRAAVAEARGVEAARLKLLQYRARRRRDGAAVVHVRVARREEFADERGKIVPYGEWEAAERHEIDDGDAIPTAGPLLLYIVVDEQ